jgi:SAM-dependent methyltransferase
MDWMHGYYAHAGYSFGYYPETMPARLRWAALRHKHLLPEANFRYLDAGFGQGYNLIIAAAMHPDSEFVGIDFMPEHVAHARDLAKRCQLRNVTIIEGDFIELAKDPTALGGFDMAVCHGISTWVAPAVKEALFRLIGGTLRPGGVFYNSYNTFPGWLGSWPFQQLVQLEQRSKPGIEAINAARETMDRLGKVSDAMFKALPSLPARLKTLDSQDPAYLMQEYNDRHWMPMYVCEMIDAMAAVKLEFLGTATLADAFDNIMKPDLRELVQSQPSTVLREQMRDYATMQSFRRDLYIKGRPNLWDVEYGEAVRSLRVMVNPLVSRPPEGESYKIQGSTVELQGNAEVYSELLDRIGGFADAPTVGELIDFERDPRRQGSVFETLSMTVHAGWVTPYLASPNPDGPKTTLAITTASSLGGPYRFIPLPSAGVAGRLNETDIILTKLVGEGVAEDQLGARLLEALSKLGRQLAKEGKPITDEAERDAMLRSLIADYKAGKLPYLKKVGCL